MTKEELVRIAVKAAGEALEDIFPDVEFHITAKGADDKSAHAEPAQKNADCPFDKMSYVNQRLLEALKSTASKVSLYRNGRGDLTAACAEPVQILNDSDEVIDAEIDAALKYIFAKMQGDCGSNACPEEDVSICDACEGHEDCEGCEGCDMCGAADYAEMTHMVNIRFGDDPANIQMDVCGNPSGTKLAAALLQAALFAMPDWSDEKWQEFLELLDELVWQLDRADQ